MSLTEKILSLVVCILIGVFPCFAQPKSPEKYVQRNEFYRDHIPEGTIIEGSAHVGGIQPDYVFDTASPEIQKLIKYGKRLDKADLTVWEKINRITKYVQQRVLPKTDYEDPDYRSLIRQHLENRIEVPLSAYVKCRAGVCREYSLLTNLILRSAGIPSSHVYAKIRRASLNATINFGENR